MYFCDDVKTVQELIINYSIIRRKQTDVRMQGNGFSINDISGDVITMEARVPGDLYFNTTSEHLRVLLWKMV